MPTAEGSTGGSLEQRTEIASQGMRGLFLINGGGAVALLAFLQSAWTTNPVLIPYIAAGTSLTFGLVFAAAVPFVRIATSLYYQSGNVSRARCYSFWHRLLEKLSILAFIVGILVVVIGVFTNLPEVGQNASSALR